MCVAMLSAHADPVSVITVLVEAVNADRQPAPSALGDAIITVRFPLIAGAIFGKPSTGDVALEQVQIGARLDLDVERMRSAGAQLASPVDFQLIQSGLVVEPRNARFARFGTFAFDSRTNRTIGAAGFVHPASRAPLALVYFDEPCRISGLLRMGNLEVAHNIVIGSRGLHWIRVKELGNNRYELDNISVTEGVILGIQPLPRPKPGQGA